MKTTTQRTSFKPPDAETQALLRRIGAVPFLNGRPLIYGIEPWIQYAVPARLAGMLRQGTLDAAMVSVVEVLFRGGYRVLADWGILSDGPVRSVLLFHQVPLEKIEMVYCDRASLTSVNLLRVLLAERGIFPRLRPLEPNQNPETLPAVLLIGDRALRWVYEGRHPAVWDLGAAWKEQTGLPFVYAVWAIRPRGASEKLCRILETAAQQGVQAIDQIAARVEKFDPTFCRDYLRHCVRYRLGPDGWAGLQKFIQLLKKYGRSSLHSIKLISSQQLENSDRS